MEIRAFMAIGAVWLVLGLFESLSMFVFSFFLLIGVVVFRAHVKIWAKRLFSRSRNNVFISQTANGVITPWCPFFLFLKKTFFTFEKIVKKIKM